ncbi:TRAP transporter substrate-binding protein [Oceanobacillus sp. CAU 1775]
MNKKLLTLLSVLFLFVVVLAACGDDKDNASGDGDGDGESVETVTLRLADIQPEGFPTVQGAEEFARLVEEKTEGRYKIDVFPGGQLGDEKSTIEELQLGSLDFARVNGVPLTEFNDKIGVLNLPYLFASQEEKWDVWTGEVGEEILASFGDNNMMGLAFYDNGERFFYTSDTPITSLEDMQGQKIRVQESELAIDIVEALGASATPMAYGEVYSAIQTGVIDGAENNFPSFFTSGHFEVANNATLPGYQSVPEVLVASQDLWDSLSEDDQKLFKEAAMESIEVQRAAWDELVIESQEEIEANGNEIHEISDIEPWREAVQSVYEKHGEQYQELLDKILE